VSLIAIEIDLMLHMHVCTAKALKCREKKESHKIYRNKIYNSELVEPPQMQQG
jgi:hypothetical protein